MAFGTPLQLVAAAPAPQPRLLTLADKLRLIQTCLADGQAEEIQTIDLRHKSALSDMMVIASGNSQRHLNALADRLEEAFRAAGERLAMEGRHTSDWLLVDAGDIIIHLFRPEMRKFYNLEKMWGV